MATSRLATALRRLPAVLGPLLFVVALFIIDRELRHIHLHEILARFAAIGPERLLGAGLVALLSYTLQTTYDVLGLGYLGHTIPYRRVALASFIGVSLSNNVGHSLFTGTSVRLRLYGESGLSPGLIATLNAFCTATIWLGFLSLAGTALVLEPAGLATGLRLPVNVRVLGMAFLGVVLAYLTLVVLHRKVTVRGVSVAPPRPKTAALQLLVASLDWGLAGTALYLLLPHELPLSLLRFLPVFLVAQVAGIASQVPGGLGVFESVMVLQLGAWLPSETVLGCLVAFRLVYYLLPLAVAAVLLGGFELRQRREAVSRVGRVVSRFVPQLAVPLLAVATFVSGVVLLVSGALPAAHGRLAVLRDLLPLPAIELSHFLGSITGFALVVLAWAVYRRVEVAWGAVVLLLGAGIVFSLAKGFDYEEALILTVFLAALLPSRRYFYRRASLLAEPLGRGWLVAIALVVGATVWLGFFAYRHVEYAGDLWWQFAFHAEAPRFLRATMGVAAAALAFGLARLLRTARPCVAATAISPDHPVRAIVAGAGSTVANLVFLGDKTVLVSARNNAFLMYGVSGKSWVAMGDPVGPVEEHAALLWRFREESHRNGYRTVCYEVGKQNLHLYLDLGLSLAKLGEEACVPLASFSLEGREHKPLRYIVRRLENDGVSFEIVPREGVPPLLPQLAAISDAWLELKATREKRFSLGYFEPSYLSEFPLAVVRAGGEVVAFANVWTAGRQELSVDLMRHRPDAPAGVMDYLFTRLMLWGAAQGFATFNLGMVPLKGLENRALAPLWHRLGAVVFRHGEHFYNFQGLRHFKEKFSPVWEPRYLASPGGLALPRIVADVAALISGSLRGAIAK